MSYTETYKWPTAIDYHDFEKYIEKKYGFNHRDYAGKYSPEGRAETDAKMEEYLTSQGFDLLEYRKVKDCPEGSKEDWPADSPEMQLRIACNNALRKAGSYDAFSRPYQDWWYQHCDDIQRGAVNYIDLADETWGGTRKEEWICEINAIWRKELEGHPAYDPDEQQVACHVDW